MRLRRSAAERDTLRIGGGILFALVCPGCGGEATPATPAGATPPQTTGEPWFAERASAAGLDFVHASGADGHYNFPEIATGGAGLLDVEGDGLLDLYLVQGADFDAASEDPSNRLFRNTGDFTFRDVTEATGTGDRGYGMGCAVADIEGDGDDDLYVTNVRANVLYRNDGGVFADVTEQAGVDGKAWSTSAAFFDWDRDGQLDLYVANYIAWSPEQERECFSGGGVRVYCSPKNYAAPAQDTLYRNTGKGRFEDVSEPAGLLKAFGNGLGVAVGDFDAEGFQDVYVANDGMPNQLWMNQGGKRFVDEALIQGCAVNYSGQSEAGMGVEAIDADHDGDLDLFLSHLRHETNTFYVNQGTWFDDLTARTGLSDTSYEATGFGLGFADFDNDGNLDLYVGNGRVSYWEPPLRADDVYAEPNLLYRSKGGLDFDEVRPRGGTAALLVDTSRAVAVGDLDNDGGVDLLVVNKDAAPYLLKNLSAAKGNWVGFDVRTADGLVAIHARLELLDEGLRRNRSVQRSYSYCASNDPRVHFGLGARERVERLRVHFEHGRAEDFGPFAAGAYHRIVAGGGRPVD